MEFNTRQTVRCQTLATLLQFTGLKFKELLCSRCVSLHLHVFEYVTARTQFAHSMLPYTPFFCCSTWSVSPRSSFCRIEHHSKSKRIFLATATQCVPCTLQRCEHDAERRAKVPLWQLADVQQPSSSTLGSFETGYQMFKSWPIFALGCSPVLSLSITTRHCARRDRSHVLQICFVVLVFSLTVKFLCQEDENFTWRRHGASRHWLLCLDCHGKTFCSEGRARNRWSVPRYSPCPRVPVGELYVREPPPEPEPGACHFKWSPASLR